MPRQQVDNCDVWFSVDFGEGPVRVLCTEIGPHKDHKCEVIRKADKEIEIGIERHNVFEDEDA